jgi:hypothetical protein
LAPYSRRIPPPRAARERFPKKRAGVATLLGERHAVKKNPAAGRFLLDFPANESKCEPRRYAHVPKATRR